MQPWGIVGRSCGKAGRSCGLAGRSCEPVCGVAGGGGGCGCCRTAAAKEFRVMAIEMAKAAAKPAVVEASVVVVVTHLRVPVAQVSAAGRSSDPSVS